MTRLTVFAPLMFLLAACAATEPPQTVSRAVIADSTLPPMKVFGPNHAPVPFRSNAALVEDFLELSFEMESGRALPVLTRFETPITLKLTGAPSASVTPDLRHLLARLRDEAGIDIRRISEGDANITVESVSRKEIGSILPNAACFVAPNVRSLAEYRRARRAPRTDWSRLDQRSTIAVFLPNDVSPQEMRDCLHEEIAQAIGPLNDLYRLPDSVFNDDNVHNVLTGSDMLLLRAYYHPSLHSGMSRAEVASVLPGILDTINPGGRGIGRAPTQPTSPAWNAAIKTALAHSTRQAQRRASAREAVAIAQQSGWHDHRLAFAHYVQGRVLQSTDPGAAHQAYLLADKYYREVPRAGLHRAYVAIQLASHAVSRGDGAAALSRIEPHLAAARDSQNAALLSTLMMLKAEALELEAREEEARAVRVDSIGWARYGFGPDWAVREKLREIASLNPRKG